jgi:hypothetical protein
VETGIVLGAIGLLSALAAGVSARVTEEARTAKCQSNLKRMIAAVHEYAADYDGTLPGPTHPAIKRHIYDIGGANPGADRQKSLAWLLRPYLPPDGPADFDPGLPDPVIDEIMRCPTASMISPDEVFFNEAAGQDGACWRERPYSYVCNTWGPIGAPGTVIGSLADWQSTDPPHYFGAWYFCDPFPGRPDASWCPKRLAEIPNASAEWATADAWYRRISAGSSRPSQFKRQWLGTYAAQATNYLSLLPSAPYHRVPAREARSHRDQGSVILPAVAFEGETNLAYFDGHISPVRAGWINLGDGGTVNPYWSSYGGTHPLYEPWYPPPCDTPPQ